ncbi:type II toxin-antitoxin system death-on-curing family toxin [Mycoplasma sp. HU2014]|uniref:type II toxin-antitoxin system death-on-curing family toxin n=1 Tax=Mycoplasma sp. HU2014 TaxID=1664275 RepID=UPI002E0D2D1E
MEYFIISNNKKIFYTNDKFYIENSNDKSELNFEISSIEFNGKFCNFIDNIYKTSIEELNKIFYSATNNLYFQEKQKGSLLSGINSTIFKYSYESDQYDIFDFVTEIFIKTLTGHYFIDGNKRTSFMLLVQLLNNFGYYFYFYDDFKNLDTTYQDTIDKQVAHFVKLLQENKTNHKEIKKWIYSRISVINIEDQVVFNNQKDCKKILILWDSISEEKLLQQTKKYQKNYLIISNLSCF